MKALVLVDACRFEVRDVPKPQIGPHEVVVEVKACGICGSDVHGMDGSTGRRKPPIVMGHEASGVVTEAGSAVQRWRPGDRVTFDSTVYCGDCHFCRRGDVNLCDNRQVLGVSCDEFKRDGAFAEYVAVPERIVVGLPDGVSFEQAAMVEPVSIAVHAAARLPVQLNDTAVVVGAGMIGLLVIQALKARGCGFVIAVDTKPDRLDLARQLGADKCFSPTDCDVVAEVMKRTGCRGADLAVEAVGFAPTVQTAVKVVRKGGSIGLVGNLSPSVELPLQVVVTRELSLYGSCASRGEYPACLDLIAGGLIEVDPLVSGFASLEDAPDWFARLHGGKENLMKVVVRP
ncbi:MAG: galactitol-1-phosphate 5-dehydrogenase [Planctomycetaceae bacterium]|nr:galactitol-1-phosphate 5-dehydrogenase [Planctomycetaceae bacterium]